ncbi:integrase core domain-containing protein [Prauserella halophila]|uniref:integrase core domain-containing protein n=1 Tax=Prauserella halophila TaxID=185641 RepID=UPI0020A4A0B9
MCANEEAATAIRACNERCPGSPTTASPPKRVLSDHGSAYRSYAWRNACSELGIVHKRPRPYRPQTNGKIERFHCTLADGWDYARLYESTDHQNAALPGWLHFYNHHRAHSTIGGRPPITRLTNPF